MGPVIGAYLKRSKSSFWSPISLRKWMRCLRATCRTSSSRKRTSVIGRKKSGGQWLKPVTQVWSWSPYVWLGGSLIPRSWSEAGNGFLWHSSPWLNVPSYTAWLRTTLSRCISFRFSPVQTYGTEPRLWLPQTSTAVCCLVNRGGFVVSS